MRILLGNGASMISTVALATGLIISSFFTTYAIAETKSCASDAYYLAKQGKQLFQSKGVCFECHGVNADGKYTNPKVDRLDPKPTDLTNKKILKYPSDEERYSAIRNGIKGTGMVPFRGILTDAEIRLIIEYLEVLKDNC